MTVRDWGTICVGTRLEKMVDSQFVADWSHLIAKGLRPGDAFLVSRDRVAHKSANALVHDFLKSDMDTICFVDSDADFGPEILEELRTLEAGMEYDALQAFYVRRGWPPEAIWFTRNALGEPCQSYIFDEGTQEVIMVGLHFTLFRREVFEKALAERDPAIAEEDYEWFAYERHVSGHEDTAFSKEVEAMGFHMGATSVVKTGHISRVVTGWETYHQFLEVSGQMKRIERFNETIKLLGEYLDMDPEMVRARSMQGSKAVRDGLEIHGINGNSDSTALKAFYGAETSGYFWDLAHWNSTPLYDMSVQPLEEFESLSTLVVGAGLGGEVDRLRGRNGVVIFELPGALRDFLRWRYKEHEPDDSVVLYEDAADLREIQGHPAHDLIVAIDTLEHIHPDAFEGTLDAMAGLLKPDGMLYFRNNFEQQDLYPIHFDHAEAYKRWLDANEFELYAGYNTGVEIWRKAGVDEVESA